MNTKRKTILVASIAFLGVSTLVHAATPSFQLLDMLAGDDDQARAQARQLLPRAEVEVVPRLVALLGSDKEQVRLTAYNVLADFANQVSVPGREADRAKVTASFMTLVAADQPAKMKLMGLRLLALVVPDGADIGPIVALLDDVELQEKARVAMVEMGTTEARTAMRDYLAKAKPEFACALLNGLAQLKDEASLPAITKLAESENPAVRTAAVRAMAWTGDPARMQIVKSVLARCDDATRGEATDAYLRLVRAMETRGGNWQAATGEYTNMLASADPKVRMAGFGGLGRMGDGSCAGPIVAAIANAKPVEWAAGIEALRQMQGVDVCREIANAYSSAAKQTQIAFLGVLGQKKHALALPILKEAATNSDAAFRLVAFTALGESALPEAIEPLAAACKGSAEDQAAARAALVALGDSLRSGKSVGTAGAAYLAALDGATHVDKPLRLRAIAGLTASPSVQAFQTAKAVAADQEARGLAIPLLVAVGDKLVEAKDNEKAVQLYQAALDLKPDTATVRGLAERMSRAGKQVNWAAQMGIVRQWFLVGPFELGEQNANWNKPLIDEPNVNLKGRYMAGKRRLDWRPAVADDPRGVVNMAAALGKVENSIGYAYAEIEVPADMDAVLRIGADDSERVWVNGQQVFDLWVARAMTIDSDRVPVKLKAGTNQILMKVWQNSMGWEFCVRVTTPDDKAVVFTQKAGQ